MARFRRSKRRGRSFSRGRKRRRTGAKQGNVTRGKSHGSHLTGSTRKIARRAMRKVQKIALPEVKRVTPVITVPTAITAGTHTARQLNGVAQGSSVTTRIGSKIHVKTIQVAFSLSSTTVTAAVGQVRTSSYVTVMIVKFQDEIETKLDGTDLPQPGAILTQPFEPELSWFVDKQNDAHTIDYKVLYKKMFVINPRYKAAQSIVIPDVYLMPGDSPINGRQIHYFNFRVPQNEKVTYINLSDTKTANNGIVIYWINSANSGSEQSVNISDFRYRILFTDS